VLTRGCCRTEPPFITNINPASVLSFGEVVTLSGLEFVNGTTFVTETVTAGVGTQGRVAATKHAFKNQNAFVITLPVLSKGTYRILPTGNGQDYTTDTSQSNEFEVVYCAAGFGQVTTDLPCSICPAGTARQAEGNLVCELCEPGTFNAAERGVYQLR